jgi:transcriptional regulator with XRE-family HTH domain
MASPNLQLRRERQLRGWSQAYVAEQLGAPDYYMSRWERGEVLPSPYYQQKLCELFGKSAEALGFLQPLNEAPPSGAARSNERMDASPTDATLSPINPLINPFTYGNPISDPARFFGRTREIEQVFSRLRNAEFESSSIVGERRTGKTSLLKYLAHSNVRRHYGLDPEHYLFVYVDLQIVDEQTTPTRLWQRLLRHIKICCPDSQLQGVLTELISTLHIDTFSLEDAFDIIDEQGYYIVLLLDEFEHVTENENFNAAFFYGLRSLAIHHHLALITSSRRELIELCHSQAIRSSPFFNIFATMTLGLFTSGEARQLIVQSLNKTGASFTEAEIARVMHLAGYHPYFLQLTCSFLFNAYAKQMDLQERIAFVQKGVREDAGPHLAFYWQSSDDHEKVVLTALALLEGYHPCSDLRDWMRQVQAWTARSIQTVARLEKRSLVSSINTVVSLFSASFGEWIWNEITDTRRNHQRYDEWIVSNRKMADRLKEVPEATRKELGEILSKTNDAYHELLFQWLIDANMLAVIATPMKALLQSGWEQPG